MPATPNPLSDLNAWLKSAGSLPEKDDGGKPATEGARSAENSADVKKLVPEMSSETFGKNPETGDADSPVPDSGLQQATTGKMPDVEKAVKVVEEESAKMAAADLTTDAGFDAAFESLNKAASYLPILFTASGVQTPGTKKANTTPAPAKPQTPAEKTAAEKVAAKVEEFARFGRDRGELTAAYLRGYDDHMAIFLKAAADGSIDAMGGPPPEMGGGMPPEAAAGGMPPEAAAGGMPPEAGPPPGGDPGAGGGAPTADDLAAAFAEMGVTPDVVMEAAQKLQEQIGGGAPAPEGAPPEAGPAPAEAEKAAAVATLAYVKKTAAEAKAKMRSGKFNLKPAADAAEAKRRTAARDYIGEMLRAAG